MSIASKVWDSAATHSSVVSSAHGSSKNVKQEFRRRSEKEAGGLEGRESERQKEGLHSAIVRTISRASCRTGSRSWSGGEGGLMTIKHIWEIAGRC